MRNPAALAAIAAALAATPARAAPEPAWERLGDWEVAPSRPGACHVRRDYPGGTWLSFRRDESGRGALLALNRGWPMRVSAPYRLSLVQDGRRRPLPPEGDPARGWQGLEAPVAADAMAALAAGGTLEVEAPDGRLLDRLDLAGLARAADRLGACATEAATAARFPPVAPPPPPPPPKRLGKTQPARAAANLPSLFSSDDYPAAAVRAGEQGAVGFRLEVDKAGRVAGCAITASSGSAALDATTCRLLSARARFTPARDRKGRPVADSLTGRIVWKLPEPEPEPPPPPPT
jgi:TonB family protein